jgi:hypothetical protein
MAPEETNRLRGGGEVIGEMALLLEEPRRLLSAEACWSNVAVLVLDKHT